MRRWAGGAGPSCKAVRGSRAWDPADCDRVVDEGVGVDEVAYFDVEAEEGGCGLVACRPV